MQPWDAVLHGKGHLEGPRTVAKPAVGAGNPCGNGTGQYPGRIARRGVEHNDVNGAQFTVIVYRRAGADASPVTFQKARQSSRNRLRSAHGDRPAETMGGRSQ